MKVSSPTASFVVRTLATAFCCVCLGLIAPTVRAADAEDGPKAAPEEGFKPGWFVFVGMTNLWSPLRESEAEVDRYANNLGEFLLPNQWITPRTFQDWSRECRLRNGWLGLGRDIDERWSWFLDMGAAGGDIANRKRYRLLGIPLKVDIEFLETSLLWEAGMAYYPWKKPMLQRADGTRNIVLRALSATRPYLASVFSYTYEWGYGRGSVRIPGLLKVYTFRKDVHDRLLWWTPQVGIETPFTQHDSLCVSAGYLFSSDRQNEYNTPTVSMSLRHKF